MTGTAYRSLARDQRGTTGCRDTAFVMIVSTWGTRPAHADIMNEVEPWQWMIALIRSAPVSSTTLRTAAGWSYAAAWSRVHGLGGRSMLARQSSSQTS